VPLPTPEGPEITMGRRSVGTVKSLSMSMSMLISGEGRGEGAVGRIGGVMKGMRDEPGGIVYVRCDVLNLEVWEAILKGRAIARGKSMCG